MPRKRLINFAYYAAVIIQPFTHNDIQLLAPLQPLDWKDIVPSFQKYVSTDHCFPIKVMDDDTMTGVGTIIVHGAVAWLANVIVRPDKRNRGIGQLITQTLIEDAQAKNCDTLLLIATDLGAPVYEKAGFVTETAYLFFRDLKPVNDRISNNIKPYQDKFREAVLTLDKKISGEEREIELDEHLENSFVYFREGSIEGLYIPGFGEGLIEATTPEAGIELMKLRLRTKDYSAFPMENTTAKQFFYQFTYKEFKMARRMRLGKAINWQPANIYSRVGGNLG